MSALEQPSSLPDSAFAAALLALPELGPSRLTQLLDTYGSANAAWRAIQRNDRSVKNGVHEGISQQWRSAAHGVDVGEHWSTMTATGITCAAPGDPAYPDRLVDDVEPPALLFSLGTIPTGPAIGIVGTRSCTAYGQRCAFELGAELARAGVTVVSGLALGIDAAAHRGVVSVPDAEGAPPLGVVGSGLDVVYPKRNKTLWADVAAHGALISEAPPGVKPARWRFPARNRIIAAMSDALIVVESHERGGSLLSVDEALDRDVPVGVIPGPITSIAAAGSNRLLVDGATPILGVDDALALIGIDHTTTSRQVDAPDPLLEAIGWSPVLLEQLCLRTAREPGELAAAVERLVMFGHCVRNGPWIERVR